MTTEQGQIEKRDVLVTLLLCEKFNPLEPQKIKNSAHQISQRCRDKENYDFLTFLRRSSNPSGALHREIQKNNLTELYGH